jgi:hypothetical protein
MIGLAVAVTAGFAVVAQGSVDSAVEPSCSCGADCSCDGCDCEQGKCNCGDDCKCESCNGKDCKCGDNCKCKDCKCKNCK